MKLENYLGPHFKENANGYKYDKWLFKPFFFLMFAWLFFVAYQYDFKLNYFNCITPGADFENSLIHIDAPQDCKNPFYKSPTWENKEYLTPGEYGTKPGRLFYSAYYMPIVLFALFLLLNHFIYNKGKKPIDLEKYKEVLDNENKDNF
jgi:hypothetical protein